MQNALPVSAILLAGGRATRLNGEDKGLIMLGEKPLAVHVLHRLLPQVSEVIISANRHLDAYRALGHTVIADNAPDYCGPLAGIAAALPFCRHEWAMVVTCDMPFLPANLAEQLWEAKSPVNDVVVVNDSIRLQPLVMLLRSDCLPSLRHAIDNRHLKVMKWIESQRHTQLLLPEPDAFMNINTPADLENIRATYFAMQG